MIPHEPYLQLKELQDRIESAVPEIIQIVRYHFFQSSMQKWRIVFFWYPLCQSFSPYKFMVYT